MAVTEGIEAVEGEVVEGEAVEGARAPDLPPVLALTGIGDQGEAYHGEMVARWAPEDPEARAALIAHLTDPGRAVETLHWGRNYLYVIHLETPRGPLPVVVKQFRNAGRRKRLERAVRGSKALRSWRVARAFQELGLPTAEPVLWLDSDRPDGPSFFVTRLLEDALEVRYVLRAANAGEAEERFPEHPVPELMEGLARLVRRLHEAGVWFRDMTSGNVLITPDGTGDPSLVLVDLNRARLGVRLSVSQRTRDLSRMPIHRPEDQDRFLRAYWGEPGSEPAGKAVGKVAGGDLPPWWRTKRSLYLAYHHGFLWKNRTKKRLRRFRDRLTGKVTARSTHPHIPDAPEQGDTRDRVVWDHLSDQPHIHASPLGKLRTRLADPREHLEELMALARVTPRVMGRYRALRRELEELGEGSPPRAAPLQGAGIAVRPWESDPEALLDALADLGAGPVLLRLHPWEPEGRDAEEALARQLVERGHEVSFALPQNRDLVRDPERWRREVEDIAERFTPWGRAFQVGQAINRSKWGVWTLREYVDLALVASEALRRARPDVWILGPSVIDFEYHLAAAALNLKRPELSFDAVSALLYVDRRGAPENPQVGFDTRGKVLLLKAIAETAANSTGRCWITEFNWPLREGPHSPAGRSVSVGEAAQADYLVRYFLETLTTGAVERVFWWQLVARGYGLLVPEADGSLRRRPAFEAFRVMLRELGGSDCLGPVDPGQVEVLEGEPRKLPKGDPGYRLYRFVAGGGRQVVAGWSTADSEGPGPREVRLRLPAAVDRVVGQQGEVFSAPADPDAPDDPATISLTPSVQYLHLA